MDKNELIKSVSIVLFNSNLIFTKESFEKELTSQMEKVNYSLNHDTFEKLVEELIQKDYLVKDDKCLIKSTGLFENNKNKQTDLLACLIKEYADSFDVNYIHDEFVKKVTHTEMLSANQNEIVEYAYKMIKNYLIKNNFAKINTIKNQFEF